MTEVTYHERLEKKKIITNPFESVPVSAFSLFGIGVCYVCVSCSVVSDSLRPCRLAHQASLSMGFSRKEYWSGLPCPPEGDLPNPGVKLTSLMFPALAGRFFTI